MKQTMMKSAARVLAMMGGNAGRHAQVDMLDVVYTKLMMGEKRATKTYSDAKGRMRKVIAARTKAGPEGDHSKVTRQRLRQQGRLKAKQQVTVAKQQAMRSGLPGGAARIRTVLDAELLMV